jgi:formiminoglutamase
MSAPSSSAAGWSARLQPLPRREEVFPRPDDPRLGEVIQDWHGDESALRPGRAVLLGFPQDEGVRRNHGRPGAADAPQAIRHALYHLTPWDPVSDTDLSQSPPLDLGNVRIAGALEETQEALAEVVAAVLQRGAVPVVLGGGHETAYGHYLGYVRAGLPAGIINIDAHLDVRPCPAGQGHSGSPFRQALEHPTLPLPGEHYVCLGARPGSVSRQHALYVREKGGVVRWIDEVRDRLDQVFREECDRLAGLGCRVYVTLDADAVTAADVPGVSAPNAAGLSGVAVAHCARLAGAAPAVASLDLVEINPRVDRDQQSVRWAALVVWQFLIGLATRPRPTR